MDDKLLRKVAARADDGAAAQRDQLQRFDWLLAALDVFVSEGIDEVRITRLADDLGVTRGSFYWHFTNRDDLIDALVDYWREKNTPAIVNAVKDSPSLDDGILGFFETCVDADLFDPRLDLAIREWARRSPDIRTELDRADEIRITTIKDFFERFGYSMPQAFIRARVMYFAQIGFYALDVKDTLDVRLSYIDAYFESFTGRNLDPAKGRRFQRRMSERFGLELP